MRGASPSGPVRTLTTKRLAKIRLGAEAAVTGVEPGGAVSTLAGRTSPASGVAPSSGPQPPSSAVESAMPTEYRARREPVIGAGRDFMVPELRQPDVRQ